MGSLFRMSERRESHEACLDGRVGSAYDFMVNVMIIDRFESSILFYTFMDGKEAWNALQNLWRILENDINGIVEWWQRNILNGWLNFSNWIVLALWLDGFSGGESYEIQNFDDVRESRIWKWEMQCMLFFETLYLVLVLVLFWYCFVLYFCETADRSLHNNNVFVVISDIIHNKECLLM